MPSLEAGQNAREVAETLDRINEAWLQGRVDDLAPLLHERMVMVLPGFSGRSTGKAAFLAGFRDFCENATVLEFRESDRQIDVVGRVAVATFTFEMIYERDGGAYRSTGRDQWVLEKDQDAWRAVWRTLLDLNEEPVSGG